MPTFQKILTANDVGATGSHQAGMHIPKSKNAFLNFLPYLQAEKRNPDNWFKCLDKEGNVWKFRFIYYNNKHHDLNGTRDEFRLTNMTRFFKHFNAMENDLFQISKEEKEEYYKIDILQEDLTNIPTIHLTGWSEVD